MHQLKQLVTALAILLSTSAVARIQASSQPADEDSWACQYHDTPNWIEEQGNWEAEPPRKKKPFIVVLDDSGFPTKESLAQATNTPLEYMEYKCMTHREGLITCASGRGQTIYFDSTADQGAYAILSVQHQVVVEYFECTRLQVLR